MFRVGFESHLWTLPLWSFASSPAPAPARFLYAPVYIWPPAPCMFQRVRVLAVCPPSLLILFNRGRALSFIIWLSPFVCPVPRRSVFVPNTRFTIRLSVLTS